MVTDKIAEKETQEYEKTLLPKQTEGFSLSEGVYQTG
jgi:hypothetical protein